jgi:DNA-binding IclR family transcriptional regulator
MERIARETGCTVNLAMRDRLCVVYIDTCRVDGGNVYQPDIGSTRPLLGSASGRALLLACQPGERTAILNKLKVLDPEQYQRDKRFWDEEEKVYALRGYTYSQGDWRKEIHAIAAPIRQSQREESVALSCTMSAYRLGMDTLKKEVAPRLLEAVRQIEMSFGLT